MAGGEWHVVIEKSPAIHRDFASCLTDFFSKGIFLLPVPPRKWSGAVPGYLVGLEFTAEREIV
jgi:hypothetical protein